MRILLSLLFLQLSSLAGKPLDIEVSAAHAILINADTGVILFEKDAHTPAYPASTTKIATALYALEKKGSSLSEWVTVPRSCLAFLPAGKSFSNRYPPYLLQPRGTMMGLQIGEVIPLRNLLQGMLLSSGNDASNVIAYHISGTIDRFMSELNLFLRSKGMEKTHFLNPHGLHHPAHSTTVYEMACLTREALKYPFFRETVKAPHLPYPVTNRRPKGGTLVQGNKLVRSGPHYYRKAIGVKTGRTDAAGYTLVAAASQGTRTLIGVVFQCPSAEQRYIDVTTLFETAFAEPLIQHTLFAKESPFFLSLKEGEKPLEGVLREDLQIEYFPAEKPSIITHVRWDTLSLPISQGQKIGALELSDGKGVIKSLPLFAREEVRQPFFSLFLAICTCYRFGIALVLFNLLLLLSYRMKKTHDLFWR